VNSVKDTIIRALESFRGDNLARAEQAFHGLSSAQMQQAYGNSGQTRQQIIDGYRAHVQDVDAAILDTRGRS